jgi:glycogen debranching enzyme
MSENKLSNDAKLKSIRVQHPELEELMKSGICVNPDTGLKYFSGYNYNTLFDWGDSYFEAIVQIYMGWPCDYIKNGVLIFLNSQQESGLISRSVPSYDDHDAEHVKPFLCQIANLVKKFYGEFQWICNEKTITRLKKYIDYWLNDMDPDNDGLSNWMSAPHTGMDTQHERAGHWKDNFCEGVDLNSYLVRELKAFSLILEDYGDKELAAKYLAISDKKKKLIREKMWDEEDKFFYDIKSGSGEFIKVKAASAFISLWAGIATKQQAKSIIERYLFNTNEFWGPYPISVLAKSEPGYSTVKLPGDVGFGMKEEWGCNWRAHTWMPVNYMIFQGLRKYGYDQLAHLVAAASMRLIEKSGNREWYCTEGGNGCGLNPFWGWTLLAYFMKYELESGIVSVAVD